MLAGMASSAGQSWSRAFEPGRNLIAAVSNVWGAAAVSSFDYANADRTYKLRFAGRVCICRRRITGNYVN